MSRSTLGTERASSQSDGVPYAVARRSLLGRLGRFDGARQVSRPVDTVVRWERALRQSDAPCLRRTLGLNEVRIPAVIDNAATVRYLGLVLLSLAMVQVSLTAQPMGRVGYRLRSAGKGGARASDRPPPALATPSNLRNPARLLVADVHPSAERASAAFLPLGPSRSTLEALILLAAPTDDAPSAATGPPTGGCTRRPRRPPAAGAHRRDLRSAGLAGG